MGVLFPHSYVQLDSGIKVQILDKIKNQIMYVLGRCCIVCVWQTEIIYFKAMYLLTHCTNSSSYEQLTQDVCWFYCWFFSPDRSSPYSLIIPLYGKLLLFGLNVILLGFVFLCPVYEYMYLFFIAHFFCNIYRAYISTSSDPSSE